MLHAYADVRSTLTRSTNTHFVLCHSSGTLRRSEVVDVIAAKAEADAKGRELAEKCAAAAAATAGSEAAEAGTVGGGARSRGGKRGGGAGKVGGPQAELRRQVQEHLSDIHTRLIPSLHSAENNFAAAVRTEAEAARTQLDVAAGVVRGVAGRASLHKLLFQLFKPCVPEPTEGKVPTSQLRDAEVKLKLSWEHNWCKALVAGDAVGRRVRQLTDQAAYFAAIAAEFDPPPGGNRGGGGAGSGGGGVDESRQLPDSAQAVIASQAWSEAAAVLGIGDDGGAGAITESAGSGSLSAGEAIARLRTRVAALDTELALAREAERTAVERSKQEKAEAAKAVADAAKADDKRVKTEKTLRTA